MLEILLMIALCKKIGREVRAKGQSPTGYQVLAVVLWIGGEFLGGMIGGVVANLSGGGDADLCFGYGLALAGAACGAGIAYTIASNVTPVHRERDFDDDVHDPFDPNRPSRPGAPPNPFKDWPDDKFKA